VSGPVLPLPAVAVPVAVAAPVTAAAAVPAAVPSEPSVAVPGIRQSPDDASHGAVGILPAVRPFLRRLVVHARAGSPRHQESTATVAGFRDRVGSGAATESGHGHPARGRSTDRGVAGHLILRCAGLPSRSALVAPPVRLAALRWREAFVLLGRSRPPPGVSSGYSESRVREPGTAGRETACLRPQSDRRMPGTRSSCPRRQPSPLRDVSCSAGYVIFAPRGAMKWRIGDVGRPGPTGAVPAISPVAFRSPAFRTLFSDDWLRHARFGEPAIGAARSVTAPLTDPVSGAVAGFRDRVGSLAAAVAVSAAVAAAAIVPAR
jgi:hypothetical protein